MKNNIVIYTTNINIFWDKYNKKIKEGYILCSASIHKKTNHDPIVFGNFRQLKYYKK